jgi:hypothetical protein
MGKRKNVRRSGPCGCGGTNENCTFCFGTGVRGGNLGRPYKPQTASPLQDEHLDDPERFERLSSAVNPLRATSTGHTTHSSGGHIITVASERTGTQPSPEEAPHG